MDERLLQNLRLSARESFLGTGIVLAYVYGSCVRGTARPDSDVDVGYYLGRREGKRRLSMHDEMVLADALTRAVGIEVDLRNLNSAPLELRGNVLEEGRRIFCSNERERVSIESSLLSHYHDYKPMFSEMHRARLAAFAASS